MAGGVYLDASALVKLVVEETETRSLRDALRSCRPRITCGLAWVEVVRSVRADGDAAVERAETLLARLDVLALRPALLADAARIEPRVLRSLDAIHVAAALRVAEVIDAVVTYDDRMVDAVVDCGLSVLTPGRSSV